MPDNTNTVAQESGRPGTNGAPVVGEPAFLARARRILAGDIRPDDYLPVTPEVRRRIDLFMEWVRARTNGQALTPEVETRQLRSELLSFHRGGVNVAYIEDETGVIVLGVGLEQASAISQTFLDELSRPIWFGVGDQWLA